MPEPSMLNADQVTDLVKSAVADAIKSVNTVDPADRPAVSAVKQSPFIRRHYGLPRLGVAMKAAFDGQFRRSQEFERDFTQAASEVFGYSNPTAEDRDPVLPDGGAAKSYRSVVWAKDRDEMTEVLYAMGEKAAAKESADLAQIDTAIKAMAEASSPLVPTYYAQDKFQYALVSMTAVRRAGVQSMPAPSNIISLPRESVAAGASLAAEAGTLTVQDPTLASQTITIKKQYGYRRYSNELLRDANPAWMEFLANTLVRDVALKQDQQFLEGTGAGNEITGLINVSGVTAGPSMGTNGASPTLDNVIDAAYLLRGANVEPNIAFGHPRTMQSLSKIKDSTGNYILWGAGGVNAPRLYNVGVGNSLTTGGNQVAQGAVGPSTTLLGQIDVYFSNQMSIARTVGSATTASDFLITNRDALLIVERQGIEVAYSEHIFFGSDETAARAIGRAAIAVLQPAALLVWTGVLA